MKKITLLLMVCAFALMGNAQVLMNETFGTDPANGFPTNDNPNTVNGWTNWAGNYLTLEPYILNGVPQDFRLNDAVALNYADLNGIYALSGQGLLLDNSYVGLSASKTPPGTTYLTYKPFTTTPVTSGNIYLSFLFQPVKAGGSQGQTISLTDSIQRSAMCLWIRPSTSTTCKLGITRSGGGSADIVNGLPDFNYGTTYLVVMKYNFTTQIAYLYVNPPIASASEPTEIAKDDGSFNTVTPTPARTAMQYVMYSNKGSNKSFFLSSGIRVSQDWASAVAALPLPKVSTPAAGSVSGIGAESFTANWTPTSDANGYNILVFNGTTQFKSTTISGKTTSSAVITGLVSNTAYTFKVQATGDGSTTANSDPSAATASFTTSDGVTSLQPDFSDGTWGTVYTASTGTTPEPPALSYPSAANGNYYVSNGFVSSVQKIGIFLPTNQTVRDTLKYWIKLDKSAALGGAYLALPSMKQVGSMELHVFTGSKSRPFLIQELSADGSWKTDFSLVTGKDSIGSNNDTIYNLTFNKSIGTKLRIVNAGGGFFGVGKIIANGVISGLADNTSNISLYSTGKTIVSSQAGTLSIYNLQGILVYKEAIENRRLTNLAAGIYIVRLKTTDGSMITRKVLLN